MNGRKTIKDVFNFSISTWINFILGFVSTFILTRIFLPEVLGTINIFYSSVTTLLQFVCFGMDSSYVRYFNEPPHHDTNKKLLCKLLFLSVAIATILGIISCIFFSSYITDYFFDQRSLALCICLSIGTVEQVLLRFLNLTYRMKLDVKNYTIQNVLINITTRFSVILGAVISKTAIAAIIANVVSVLIVLCVYLYKQRNDWFIRDLKLDYTGYKEVFTFALLGAPAAILLYIYPLSSQMVLKSTLGVAAVGIYSSAAYFSSILSVIKGGFMNYWSAFMYANYNKEKDTIVEMHDVIMLCAILFMFGIVALRDVAYLFIGANYQDSKPFFQLVLMFPLLQTVQETTAYGIQIAKKTYINSIISGISLTVNVFFGFYLVDFFGIAGIAFSNFLAALISFVLFTAFGQKYYKSIKSTTRSILGLSIISCIAVVSYFIENSILNICINFGLVIFSMFLYRETVKKIYKAINSFIR